MQPSNTETTPKFGKSMLKYFCMDPNYTNLNSPSCGSYPIVVRDAINKFQQEFEAQPDVFAEFKQCALIDEARAGIAGILKCSPSDCVFIKNATTGIFTVLQNLPYKPGDVILYFTTTYGAVENAVLSLKETRPIRGRKIEYDFPITTEEIIAKFCDEIRAVRGEGLHPMLAILDTIVSVPGIRFPFERLVEVCKEEGILSLIDGAHSIGHIQMNLDQLQPDFYITDCHKWLNVPRGCAVLYVPVHHQHFFRTTVPPSFGFIPTTGPVVPPLWAQQSGSNSSKPESVFQRLFKLVPTADDTPYLCIPTALKFRQQVCGGEQQIYKYLRSLACEGAGRMALILHTEVLDEPQLPSGRYSQMRDCGIATVRLPLATGDHKTGMTPYPPLEGKEILIAIRYLSRALAHEHGTWMPMLELNGWIWVRVCAQVFLEISDFEWAGSVLKELSEKVGRRCTDA